MHIWWKKLFHFKTDKKHNYLFWWGNSLPTGMKQLTYLFFRLLGNIVCAMRTGRAPSCWHDMQDALCQEPGLVLLSLSLNMHRGSSSQTPHPGEAEDATLADASCGGTRFTPFCVHSDVHCDAWTPHGLVNGYSAESSPPGPRSTEHLEH